MKRHKVSIMKNTFTRFTAKVMFAAFLFAAASNNAAFASNGDPVKEEPVIKLLGKTYDSNFFSVKFNNESGDKFLVTVKEKNGSVLFQETYKEEKFDKNFRVPRTEQGAFVFIFRNIKTNKSEVYEIDTNTRVIEEVTIKKLD